MKTTFKILTLATLLSASFTSNVWSTEADAAADGIPASTLAQLGPGGTDCSAISQNTVELPEGAEQAPGSDNGSVVGDKE